MHSLCHSFSFSFQMFSTVLQCSEVSCSCRSTLQVDVIGVMWFCSCTVHTWHVLSSCRTVFFFKTQKLCIWTAQHESWYVLWGVWGVVRMPHTAAVAVV